MAAGDLLSPKAISNPHRRHCAKLSVGDGHEYYFVADQFSCYGVCRPFSVSESKGRACSHLFDAGDFPEDLGWGTEDHRQR
jgi:hypothetical protein